MPARGPFWPSPYRNIAHADGAAHVGQPVPRRASLQVGGHDDARGRRQVTAGAAGTGQDGGGLARGGGREAKAGSHKCPRPV